MIEWILISVITGVLARLLGFFGPRLFGLSSKTLRILWIFILIRLLCPINFSLPGMQPLTIYPKVASFEGDHDIITQRMIRVGETVVQKGTPSSMFPWHYLKTFYLMGILFSFGITMMRFLKAKRKLQRISRCPKNYEGSLLPEELMKVRILDHRGTPFLMGILSPTLYLPRDFFLREEKTRALTLEHERTHLRHRDHLVKLLYVLARSLHWANPLVYFGNSLDQALEFAVDDEVTKKMTPKEKKEYCSMILEDMTYATWGCTTALSGNGKEMKERMNYMFRKKSSHSKLLIWPILLLFLSSFLVSCNGVRKSEIPKGLYVPRTMDKGVFALSIEEDSFDLSGHLKGKAIVKPGSLKLETPGGEEAFTLKEGILLPSSGNAMEEFRQEWISLSTLGQEIYGNRTTYLGDASKVGALREIFFEIPQREFSLQTEKEPYSAVFKMEGVTDEESAQLEKRGALLLSLISNCDSITLEVGNSKITVSRKDVPVILGMDPKTLYQSEEKFVKLYGQIMEGVLLRR